MIPAWMILVMWLTGCLTALLCVIARTQTLERIAREQREFEAAQDAGQHALERESWRAN